MLSSAAVFFHIDAGQLESGIRKKIFSLPSDVRVFKVAKFKNLNLLACEEGINWEEDMTTMGMIMGTVLQTFILA